MKNDLIEKLGTKPPLGVISWTDPGGTGATGWLVINSLTGNACGGGTRMHSHVTYEEVLALAKTMEIKFRACKFGIGGAKSGIRFDPNDPRKEEVLRRFYEFIAPYLKNHYGTGGDWNVPFSEVSKMLSQLEIPNPQYGVVAGKFGNAYLMKRLEQLQYVERPIEDSAYAPYPAEEVYTYADLVTGYGVAQATIEAFRLQGEAITGKRIAIQGWGTVGAVAGFYLAKEGAVIAGIIDVEGYILEELSFPEVIALTTDALKRKHKQKLLHPKYIPITHGSKFWNGEFDAFLPCAGSKLVTSSHIHKMINHSTKQEKKLVIVAGANNPFAEKETLYGSLSQELDADERVFLVPDFVANMGMARLFYVLMNTVNEEISPDLVFKDIRTTILSHFEGAPTTGFAKHVLEKLLTEEMVTA